MQQFMKYALLGLAMVCASVFTGCISRKTADGLGARVLRDVLEIGLDPAFELAYASNEFRVAKHRWPRDYEELSSFLKQADDKTYSSFQAVKYHPITFTETADGKLRIEADYTLNLNSPARKLTSGDTVSSASGTGRIEFMLSPFDPHEMRLPPDHDGAANRSQPGSSDTNRTSEAAGSGR